MIKGSAMCAKSLAKYRSREVYEDGWRALKTMSDVAHEGSVELAPDQNIAYLSAWLETELSLIEAVAKQKGKNKNREEDGLKSEPFFIVMLFERLLGAIESSSIRSAKTHQGATWIRYHRYMVSLSCAPRSGRQRLIHTMTFAPLPAQHERYCQGGSGQGLDASGAMLS
jgi:hypothetical protein